MRILFLDLAHHDGSVACVTETETIARRAVDQRLRDDGLVPLIDEVLAAAQWKAEDLTAIGCITGPGGFTSLRVAVATANALAWERKIPVRAVHGSDLWAARLTSPDALWFHSTRLDQVFARGFGQHARLWPEAGLQTLDTILKAAPQGSAWMGELIPTHAEKLAPLRLVPAPLKPVEEVLPGLLAHASGSAAPIDPWYGRGY